jgi:mono/diheme cytochrome c family protein
MVGWPERRMIHLTDCHGWNSEGPRHAQAPPRRIYSVNDPNAAKSPRVVLNGAHLETPDEGEAFKPAFARAWPDVEIAAVANYVVAHFGGKQPSVMPMNAAAARELP